MISSCVFVSPVHALHLHLTVKRQPSYQKCNHPRGPRSSPRTTCTASGPDSPRRQLRQLRHDLAEAIAAQRFSDAASLRDRLSAAEAALANDDYAAVCVANDAFYFAYRAADPNLMADVWLQADTVSCAHPLSGLVVGFEEVLSSWRAVFAMGKPTSVDVEEVSINVRRNVAWVVCQQTVQSVRGQISIGGLRIATNVFQKRHGKWRMVHHHASPVVAEQGSDDKPQT